MSTHDSSAQTPNRRCLTIVHRFSRPPAKVWQAWTDPNIARLCFGSDPGGTVPDARMDARVGGSFAVRFVNSDQTECTCMGRYLEVEPCEKLAITWTRKDRQDVEERVEIALEPDKGGTLMSFEHADIDTATAHEYAPGWKRTF